MVEDSDTEVVTYVNTCQDDPKSNLCYKCRRISPDNVSIRGGLYHSHTLVDVIKSAQHCSFCRLIQDGLQTDIADELEQDDAMSKPINISLDRVYYSRFGLSLCAGLRISILSENTSCMFNWYLPHKGIVSSPVRPVGLQKLHAAKSWLERSIAKTEKCANLSGRRALAATRFSPTRLLDLGSGPYYRPDDVRLISHCNDLAYIALSHRWGGLQHLTTTRSTYLQHMLGIKLHDLPETFQDAIIVARFLGVRYLWIDALCIVQDDTVDWHREALQMGEIYQESVCTIAVHDACNDSAGFLQRSLAPPIAINIGSTVVTPRSNFRAEVDKSALSGRGWVLQERFLSARTLHFTKDSVFLEDSEGIFKEEDAFIPDPSGRKLLQDLPSTDALSANALTIKAPYPALGTSSQPTSSLAIGDGTSWNLVQARQPRLEDWHPTRHAVKPFKFLARTRYVSDCEDLKYQWFEILERYSQTQLTYESDKLPAIAGLARVFQEHTGDCYISGMWRRTAYIGLLWYALGSPLKRSTSYRAASWSWASMDGPIHYPDYRSSLRKRVTINKSTLPVSLTFFDPVEFLTLTARMKRLHNLEPIREGEKTDATCFIHRPVHLCRLFDIVKPRKLIWFTPENAEKERRKQRYGVHSQMGFAVLDDCFNELSNSSIWCIQLAHQSQGFRGVATPNEYYSGIDWALLVTSSSQHPNCWRRVGIAVITCGYLMENWFEDTAPSTITLV